MAAVHRFLEEVWLFTEGG
ncbi:unnamed protein product [Linum tenue]|uniref:Uncharacterized protein n=1 Tax=Linum tenue TaxID=586396 RepID=A0AAV0QNE6_9ROSI|nr:unnamed protein product [Linum tenue]